MSCMSLQYRTCNKAQIYITQSGTHVFIFVLWVVDALRRDSFSAWYLSLIHPSSFFSMLSAIIFIQKEVQRSKG